jgi:hypothetical protein
LSVPLAGSSVTGDWLAIMRASHPVVKPLSTSLQSGSVSID